MLIKYNIYEMFFRDDIIFARHIEWLTIHLHIFKSAKPSLNLLCYVLLDEVRKLVFLPRFLGFIGVLFSHG